MDGLRQQLLAEIDLRLGIVEAVALVLHDLEVQMVERPPHLVKLVFRLDDDLVEPLLDRPVLLLLGQRAEEPLAAPIAPRSADPRVQHAPPIEMDEPLEAVHEIDELGLALRNLDFMRDFEGNRHDGTRIVRQGRARKQDQMCPPLQSANDLRRGFLARKLTEEFLDVLDLEGALLELVLRDAILHSLKTEIVCRNSDRLTGPCSGNRAAAATDAPRPPCRFQTPSGRCSYR